MTGVTVVAQDHRGLVAWQRTMEPPSECHRLAARLPEYERFGLADQIRRAAVSVPANIAEGNGRVHRGDYRRRLSIARDFLDQSLRMLTVLGRRLRA